MRRDKNKPVRRVVEDFHTYPTEAAAIMYATNAFFDITIDGPNVFAERPDAKDRLFRLDEVTVSPAFSANKDVVMYAWIEV